MRAGRRGQQRSRPRLASCWPVLEQLHGDFADALVQARAVARELHCQGKAELAALARLIVIILRLVSDGRDPATSRQAGN